MSSPPETIAWTVPPDVDDELYKQAMQFAQQEFAVGIDAAQGSSLLAYAQRWQDVQEFVRRQASRTWQDNKQHYKTFYINLQKELGELEKRAQKHVPPNLSMNEVRRHSAPIAGSLAQAFLQHLCAQALLTARRERR